MRRKGEKSAVPFRQVRQRLPREREDLRTREGSFADVGGCLLECLHVRGCCGSGHDSLSCDPSLASGAASGHEESFTFHANLLLVLVDYKKLGKGNFSPAPVPSKRHSS